jgi:hypothetical protein
MVFFVLFRRHLTGGGKASQPEPHGEKADSE